MASRSPLALIPEMRELYKAFCAEMDKAGISWILTCCGTGSYETPSSWTRRP